MRVVIRIAVKSVFCNPKEGLLILCNLILCTSVVFVFLQNFHFLKNHYDEIYDDSVIAKNYSFHMSSEDMQEYLNDCKNRSPMFYTGEEVFAEIDALPSVAMYKFTYLTLETSELSDEMKWDSVSYYDEYGEYNYINACEVSEETLNALNLTLGERNAFSTEDYKNTYSDKPVSVILGSQYREFISIGDTFSYAGDSAIVVGFLDSGAYVSNSGCIYYLDDYMIFPCGFPRTFEEANEYSYRETVRLDYNIHVGDESIDLQSEVNSITTRKGYYTIVVNPTDGVEISNTKGISERNVYLIGLLAIIGGGICVASLGTIMANRTKANTINYCIYMCNGISNTKICASLILETFTLLLISLCPVIALSIHEYGELLVPVWQILLLSLVVLLTALIPALRLIKNCNLDLLIRRRVD